MVFKYNWRQQEGTITPIMMTHKHEAVYYDFPPEVRERVSASRTGRAAVLMINGCAVLSQVCVSDAKQSFFFRLCFFSCYSWQTGNVISLIPAVPGNRDSNHHRFCCIVCFPTFARLHGAICIVSKCAHPVLAIKNRWNRKHLGCPLVAGCRINDEASLLLWKCFVCLVHLTYRSAEKYTNWQLWE